MVYEFYNFVLVVLNDIMSMLVAGSVSSNGVNEYVVS